MAVHRTAVARQRRSIAEPPARGPAASPYRQGLTMLEVLLAVALLSLVAVALVGWMRMGLRSSTTAVAEAEALQVRLTIAERLRRDVAARLAEPQVADGALAIEAVIGVGDELPRPQQVHWRWDADERQLLRRGAAGERVVWQGGAAVPELLADDEGVWLSWSDPERTAADRYLIAPQRQGDGR